MKKILIAALFLCCATFANAQNLVVSDSASSISPEQMQTIETYKSTCAQKVEENWRKSNIKHDDVTIKITFKSLQDGTIDDLELEIPSKYEQNNKAAIKAIEDAAPFDAIPQELNAQEAQHVMFFPCRRFAQITPFSGN